jgi:hypothetical protein
LYNAKPNKDPTLILYVFVEEVEQEQQSHIEVTEYIPTVVPPMYPTIPEDEEKKLGY